MLLLQPLLNDVANEPLSVLLIGEALVDDHEWRALLPHAQIVHAELSACPARSFDLVVVQRQQPDDDIEDLRELLLGSTACDVLHEGLVVVSRVLPPSAEWLTTLSLQLNSTAGPGAHKLRQIRVAAVPQLAKL